MRKIVCIGGLLGIKSKDNVFLPYTPNNIDLEILNLSEKNNPKVLFIGTASKEREDYYNSFKAAYEKLGASVENLIILDNKLSNEEIREKILSVDIIYVGCGKTKFMLEIWKRKDIDKALVEACNKGIVLAGMSAGSYCWFKYNYELIQGVNLIEMINCVHYEEKNEKKKKIFYDNIQRLGIKGIALDNDISIVFLDDKYKVVKNKDSAKAYEIEYKNNEFIKKEIM